MDTSLRKLWEIVKDRGPGVLQSTELQRVRHNLATEQSLCCDHVFPNRKLAHVFRQWIFLFPPSLWICLKEGFCKQREMHWSNCFLSKRVKWKLTWENLGRVTVGGNYILGKARWGSWQKTVRGPTAAAAADMLTTLGVVNAGTLQASCCADSPVTLHSRTAKPH